MVAVLHFQVESAFKRLRPYNYISSFVYEHSLLINCYQCHTFGETLSIIILRLYYNRAPAIDVTKLTTPINTKKDGGRLTRL